MNKQFQTASAARGGVCGLTAVIIALVLAAGAGCHRRAQPNIILYVVDTMRFDALHCDGDTALQTPAMDRLAKEGMRFTRAYANASWTRPSVGSLLTGEYPSGHGAVRRLDALRPGVTTLPAKLHTLGYRTAAIVANPNIGSPFGFAEGFDEFIELYEPHGGNVLPAELIATADRVVDRAIAWLEGAPPAPFFLLVFSIDPHAPYTPPPPYSTLYDADYSGPVDGSLSSLLGLAMFGPVPPEREIRHLRALYHGEVTFNDAQLARLLGTLPGRGLEASTLLVLTSDHGEEFYEHGSRDHGHTLYEELIHIPLIVRWPGTVPAGTTSTAMTQLVDLYPTLLHLAGGRIVPGATAGTPGRDLTEILLGKATDGLAPRVYAEEDLDEHHLQAAIDGNYKLIVDLVTGRPFTFDLGKDPGESHPLPGLPPRRLVLALEDANKNQQSRAGAPSRKVAATELPDSVRHALKALGYGDPAEPR